MILAFKQRFITVTICSNTVTSILMLFISVTREYYKYLKRKCIIHKYIYQHGNRKLTNNFSLEHASTTMFYDFKQKHHFQFWHWIVLDGRYVTGTHTPPAFWASDRMLIGYLLLYW